MKIDFPYSTAWDTALPHAVKFMRPIYPIKTIVEIGCDYGFSTMFFANHCRGSKVITVDNFCYKQEPDTKTVITGLIAKYHPRDIDLWEMESGDAAERYAHGCFDEIDVLHLDAGHAYEEVKRDYELWSPHVRKGGLILFHDVVIFSDDVGRFFHSLEGRKKLWDESPGLGAYYKE